MNHGIRRTTAALVALVVSAGGVAVLSMGSADAAALPWGTDSSSVADIRFYNDAGTEVTSGGIDDLPFATYVQSTAVIRPTDTKASVIAALPKAGLTPAEWSTEALSGSTSYPIGGAPTAIANSTLPVAKVLEADLSIGELTDILPNTATNEYQGIYQIRVLTSAPGSPPGTVQYASTAIKITGSAWARVNPVVEPSSTSSPSNTSVSATPTNTSVSPTPTNTSVSPTPTNTSVSPTPTNTSVSPTPTNTSASPTPSAPTATTTLLNIAPKTPAYHGTSVRFTANISPTTAAGSVDFKYGNSLLKKVAVVNGVATFTTATLSNNTFSFKAVFVPTDATAFKTSSSNAQWYTVKVRPTVSTLTLSKTSVKKGVGVTLTARLNTTSAPGTFKFYDGSVLIKSVGAPKGKAVFAKKFAVGKHKLKVKFVPLRAKDHGASASAVKSLTVKK